MKKTYTVKKKIIYLSFILLLTSVALSEPEWITFPGGSGVPGEKPIITILQNGLDYTEYTVDIPGMWRHQEEAPNGDFFDVIELPEYGHTLEVGLPRIPVMRDLFAVPHNCSDIIIQTSDVQTVILDNYYIYPQQPSYPYLQEPPPFEYDEDFYNSNVWYPLEGIATGDMPGILRELEVRDMNMSAIKFNPYQRQLDVKYHFKVTMTYINPGGWISEPSPSGDFYQMYPYLITNIEGISGFGDFGKEGKAPGQYTYMIIHDSRFDDDPDFRAVMEQFYIFLRDYRGFDVVVKSTTDIGGNSAFYIWDYLKKYFDDHRNLEYVLLVGDIPESEGDPYGIDMPAWTIYQDSYGIRAFSDMGYARLTPLKEMDPLETDPFPDITVGRMVVNDADEFENIVYKTTQYYYTDNGDYPWEKHCLIATGKKKILNEPDDIYTKTKRRIENYGNYFKGPDWWEEVFGQYSNGTNEHVRDYINGDGCSILNFYAHGGVDCWAQWSYNNENWDRSYILQLNNRALPVVFQCACLVGSLDNPGYPAPDSLCEEWLNSPVGAVACCGSTSQLQCWDMKKFDPEPTSMVDDFWFRCIYGEITGGLIPKFPIRSFGTVVYAGISKWISTYIYTFSQSSSYVLSTIQLGYVDSINIYGDPSLLMRSGVDWTGFLGNETKNSDNIKLTPISIEKIYPCPASDYINCVLSVPNAKVVNISIYDISGRLVSESVLSIDKPGIIEAKINTNGLADGVYILNATSGVEKVTKNFIIVR